MAPAIAHGAGIHDKENLNPTTLAQVSWFNESADKSKSGKSAQRFSVWNCVNTKMERFYDSEKR